MPRRSLSIGTLALAASVVVPAQAQAEHENRYFGFGYQPNPYVYAPPPIFYPPPPGVRETAPGVYEYEVAPGQWVRVRPGYGYREQRRDRRLRARRQPLDALRSPGPPPVPQRKPEPGDEPEVAVRGVPAATPPAQAAAQAPATSAGAVISCEAAADIIKSFGFSDVQPTRCSGDTYGFDAARDGNAYSIEVSSVDGELTEVRKR